MNKISLPINTKVVLDKDNRAVLEIEGCWPGYGITLGNALRRAMLSSLPGAAITGVKIKGVQHEFSAVPFVLENVIDIMLNLKKVRFKLHSSEPQTVILKVKGEKEVKASDLECPSQVEVVSLDALIATLTDKKAELEMEIEVSQGIGFLLADQKKTEKVEIGKILVDAIFTPIRKVNFEVKNMRVGDRTDFNKLIIDIETDGSITPQEAFERSCHILVEQFDALAKNLFADDEKSADEEVAVAGGDEEATKTKVEDLKLSARTLNALVGGSIKTVGGLTKKTESDLTELKGMGDKGITEIKKAVKKLGLALKEE